MFRVIGATACATVAAVSLWLLYPNDAVETVRASEAREQASSSRYSKSSISAARYFTLGKEHYRAGRQSAAVRAFRAALASSSELTAEERHEARQLLGMLDPTFGKTNTVVSQEMQVPAQTAKTVEAIKIDDLMTRAKLALHEGETKDAWQLAAEAEKIVKEHDVQLSPIAERPSAFLSDLASGKTTMRGQSPEEEEPLFILPEEAAADTEEATASLKAKAQGLLKEAEQNLKAGFYD
ncbi:MAG: hypothetical protein R3C11_09115 [Planctomycetaceae bacterium]